MTAIDRTQALADVMAGETVEESTETSDRGFDPSTLVFANEDPEFPGQWAYQTDALDATLWAAVQRLADRVNALENP